MTFIDWADPEEMFGLLCEYVADQLGDSRNESARRRFLAELSDDLDSLAEQFGTLTEHEVIGKLRGIRCVQQGEFERDPILEHLDACIEELERIRRGHE